MKILHYSQQFARSPEKLDAALTALLGTEEGPGIPNIATLTEVANTPRRDVLAREGWTVTQAHKSLGIRAADCAILTRDSAFTVLHRRAWEVTNLPFRSKRGRKVRGWWAIAVVLEDKAGERVLVTAAHPPAGLISRARRKAHKAGIQSWGQHVLGYADEQNCDRIVIAADWNKNLNNPADRGYVKSAFPDCHVVASKAPTHDKRTIDGLVVRGFRPALVDVLPVTPASDHLPVLFILGKETVYPPAYEKTTHDGKTVDQITHYALLECERRLGYELTITQGSYNKGGVSASAGTHDGGGVVDLAPFDSSHKVRVASNVGFCVWHRPAIPGLWPEHIHMVLRGNLKLSPAAAQQVGAWERGEDGLKDHAHDPHPHPVNVFQYPPRTHG